MEVGSRHRVAFRKGWRWGCQPARGDWSHHTEHLCTGFMGEFLGQWKTRPNSSNCETLPRTLPGERNNSELSTSCPTSATPMHPTPGIHSPQQHPTLCPLLVLHWCKSHLAWHCQP